VIRQRLGPERVDLESRRLHARSRLRRRGPLEQRLANGQRGEQCHEPYANDEVSHAAKGGTRRRATQALVCCTVDLSPSRSTSDRGEHMQKITPFLWFDNQAEQAMNFYVSIFKNSKVLGVSRYGDAGPGPKGSVMTANFQLDGQQFSALNGGPHFKFTEAISFVVNCETQQEIDELWSKLTAGGGKESECGWLKDRFGLSWQIVPTALNTLLREGSPEQSQRVMSALLKMKKLDIQRLKDAYNGNA
jgi:predicted 3-demethylubiquinone-9 3-methyltransferase (glyoxalase superfamily)